MSVTQYLLNWDSYKSNVCNGFTYLQQNEEFVDLTLAADGHIVKVHKNIFALASPYIKSMLQSSRNEHPIIFLSNVSHEVLNYILTYVYTGEVSVEVDKIQAFMKVAKDLHLSGLFSVPVPKVGSRENTEMFHRDFNKQRHKENDIPDIESPIEGRGNNNALLVDSISVSEPTLLNTDMLDKTVSAEPFSDSKVENVSMGKTLSGDINIQKDSEFMSNEEMLNNRNTGLYMTADGYQYKLEIKQAFNQHPNSNPIVAEDTQNKPSDLQSSNYINIAVKSNDDNDFGSFEDEFKNKMKTAPFHIGSLDPKAITPQYTMSNRGSLQLILNRYIYCCHHQSHGGRKRRWRCIEYRSKHCPAFIDTDGEIMTSRKFGHTHSFHDEKIRIKMKRDLVFTNLNILLEKQNEKSISKN